MNENINLIEIIKAEWKRKEDIEKQEHIHQDGKRGGSNLNGCNFITAIKEARVKKLPIKEGLKAHKGGLNTGKWLHDKLENTLDNYFTKYSGQYPDLIPASEIFVLTPISLLNDEEIIKLLDEKGFPIKEFLEETTEALSPNILDMGIPLNDLINQSNVILDNFTVIIPRTFEDVLLYRAKWLNDIGIDIIESPIDFALLSKPGFILKPISFRNIIMYQKFKHPFAQWIKMWDIKSAGNYGFWKAKTEGISDNYRAQFHGYMRGRLPEMTMLDIHKAKAFLFEKVCKYDEEIWENIVLKHNRMKELSENLSDYKEYVDIRGRKGLPVTFNDFNCICQEDAFNWYGCELSETYEEEYGVFQEPKLKLKKLCPHAERFLHDKCIEKYHLDSTWNRGRSKVTITKIDINGVYSRSSRGKLYEDSLYYAFKKYSKIG